MFRHRRVRVLTVLLSGWVVLTAVERVAEDAPWPSAVLGGLLWASLVAAVWWFAEWTQSPLRTARAKRHRHAGGKPPCRTGKQSTQTRTWSPVAIPGPPAAGPTPRLQRLTDASPDQDPSARTARAHLLGAH
ncbi:hypothetical protein, partial [Streptomyces sp. NPDC057428]|uniref:hypothetical protein n=1 Tax=Streptomyces sp. NPDC057428 TaxID=3346129 RepID=UPI0036C027CA